MAGRYVGAFREDDFHGHGTFTSTSGGWSFTGTLARDRPVAGVLTEPGGRRFEVEYAGDCATMQNNPTPSSKAQMETEEEEAQLKAYFATGCGSEMRTWLLHKGIDQTDVGSIVLRFLKPEYGVKTLLELFALEDADIDEVLQGLPLAKRKVLKALIKQDRDGI